MSRLVTVTLSVALGLVLGAGVGVARADGPGAAYAGEEIGTIRFLDRAQNLVVLTGGGEFYATDARMLSNLTEGGEGGLHPRLRSVDHQLHRCVVSTTT